MFFSTSSVVLLPPYQMLFDVEPLKGVGAVLTSAKLVRKSRAGVDRFDGLAEFAG